MKSTLLTALCSLSLLASTGCIRTFDDDAPPLGIPGPAGLVRLTPEPPGDNCVAGGQRAETGLDLDASGSLDDDEVTGNPTFVCDGPTGDAGAAGIVEITAEPAGATCVNGGTRLRAGIDSDGDAALSDEEVQGETVICDGAPGVGGDDGLMTIADEPPGANCAAGGQRVEVGHDDDDDGELDPGEVAVTRFVCNGEDGPTGTPGADGTTPLVVVAVEQPGGACPDGGQRVESGRDLDGNGALEGDELEGVAFVCDAGGGGAGVVLGAGRAEGIASAPVALPITRLTNGGAPRLSTVAELTTSFYAITTLAGGSAAYVFSTFGEDSPLQLQLFSDPALTQEVALACTRNGNDQTCTAELAAAADHVLTVTEGTATGNSFGLTASVGEARGDLLAPVPLTDNQGTSNGVRASIPDAGESVYSFFVPTSGVYTLQLTAAAGLSTADLVWTVLDQNDLDNATCTGTQPCPAGHLAGGLAHRIRFSSPGAGAGVDLSVTAGDAFTEVLPLNSLQIVDDMTLANVRLFRFETNASTEYTLRTYGLFGYRYYTLLNFPIDPAGYAYEVIDRCDVAVGFHCFLEPDFEGFISGLGPNRSYYLLLMDEEDSPNPVELFLGDRGGDEADVPLTVGAAHPGSAEFNSTYSFTTGATPARHTIRVDWPLPVTASSHRLIVSGGSVVTREVRDPLLERETDDPIIVTDVLDANTTFNMDFSTATALYDLSVTAGDTITTSLTPGTLSGVSIPSGEVRFFSIDAGVEAFDLQITGGNLRVMGTDPFPETIGEPDNDDVVFFCEGANCGGPLVVNGDRTVLTVENPTPVDQVIDLTLTQQAATILPNTPVTLDLVEREITRFLYVNDTEAPQAVRVVNPDGRRYNFRLRADDFSETYASSQTTSGNTTYELPVDNSPSVPLPVGTYILEIEFDSNFTDRMTIEVER